MRYEVIDLETLLRLLEKNELNGLQELIKDSHPVDLAEIFEELSPEDGIKFFDILDLETSIEVFEELGSKQKLYILDHIELDSAEKLVEEMPTDVLAELIRDLSEDDKKIVFSLMEKQDEKALKGLLTYREDSAGGLMTTEFIALSLDLNAQVALNELSKAAPDAETIYYVFVVDEANKLVGVVSLRDLIIASEQTLIKDIMRTDVKSINVAAHRQEAAKLISRYGFLALPVVDDSGILLGIVTVDDAMMIVEEEGTEDIYKLAGSDYDENVALGKSNPWQRAKRRLPWIMIAVVGEIFSGRVINSFSQALETLVALSFFIPVLMDMGGNVGTQSAAIVVRALAIGEMKSISLIKNVLRELAVGIILGLANGALVAVIAYIWTGNGLIGITVGLAMIFNLALAATLGAFIPLLWHRVGYDPAVASGPLVTTILDIFGLFTYFSVATWLLGI